MDTEKAKCYQRPNIILKDICQSKNPISVGLELGLTNLKNPCDRSRRRFLKIPVTEVVADSQKPCDKSRRRILKKYISVPKSAILKLKPNKDEVGHFEIEAKQRRVGHFEFTSNKEG